MAVQGPGPELRGTVHQFVVQQDTGHGHVFDPHVVSGLEYGHDYPLRLGRRGWLAAVV
jgi:hypothetical protein